jgi:hypothetical protein
LLRDFIFSRDDTGTGGLDVTISGLATNGAHRLTVWSFDSGSSGDRVSDWSANGVSVTNGYTFNGSTLPTSNEQYRFSFDTIANDSGGIVLSGRRNPASIASFGVYLNALKIETVASVSATNGLGALMLSNNASAYIRIPFTVSDPNAFQTLKLRMKYDDGFVACINGQLAVSRNAPASRDERRPLPCGQFVSESRRASLQPIRRRCAGGFRSGHESHERRRHQFTLRLMAPTRAFTALARWRRRPRRMRTPLPSTRQCSSAHAFSMEPIGARWSKPHSLHPRT